VTLSQYNNTTVAVKLNPVLTLFKSTLLKHPCYRSLWNTDHWSVAPASRGKEHYETKLICRLLAWIFPRQRKSLNGSLFNKKAFFLIIYIYSYRPLTCNSESGISIWCFFIKCFSLHILKAFIRIHKLTFWTPRIICIYRGEIRVRS